MGDDTGCAKLVTTLLHDHPAMLNIFQKKVKLFILSLRHLLIKWLAQDDLVIVGDIYCQTGSPAPIQIRGGGIIVGDLKTWDGPTSVVPRGCEPKQEPLKGVCIDLCFSDGSKNS